MQGLVIAICFISIFNTVFLIKNLKKLSNQEKSIREQDKRFTTEIKTLHRSMTRLENKNPSSQQEEKIKNTLEDIMEQQLEHHKKPAA
jgi:hypothetical protein